MSCDFCTDPEGESCFPMYGVGPHYHSTEHGGKMYATYTIPKEDWPPNYKEDPDCPGCGTWWCPVCEKGKPL